MRITGKNWIREKENDTVHNPGREYFKNSGSQNNRRFFLTDAQLQREFKKAKISVHDGIRIS